jgi:CheY-like chemotaxis protein
MTFGCRGMLGHQSGAMFYAKAVPVSASLAHPVGQVGELLMNFARVSLNGGGAELEQSKDGGRAERRVELLSEQRRQASVLPRLRLLIVDDEPRLLRVLAISLTDEHEIVTATGCEAALRIIDQANHFDAILCDLMMPLGDGTIFYERLGQVRPELRARIVFMTGGAFTPRARTFLNSIPNRTIEKPFGSDLLRRILTEVIGSSSESLRARGRA